MEDIIFRRIIAYLIDINITQIPWLIALLVLMVLTMTGVYDINPYLFLGSIILLTLTTYYYFLVKDGIFEGQSLGKKMLGIQVLHDNRPCGKLRSCARNFVILLPVMPLIEFIVMLSRKGKRLGDQIANTKVVKARKTGNKGWVMMGAILLVSLLSAVMLVASAKDAYFLRIQLEPETRLSQLEMHDARELLHERMGTVGRARIIDGKLCLEFKEDMEGEFVEKILRKEYQDCKPLPTSFAIGQIYML